MAGLAAGAGAEAERGRGWRGGGAGRGWGGRGYNIGLTLPTLTSEEQEALRVVGGADHGLAAVGTEGGPMDAELDGEEEDMPMQEDDTLDNAETDMQLDG